jgi:hypothetical protein
MKRLILILIAVIALVVLALIFSDFYDPSPVETPTKTCEPIGAQHPKTDSKECKQ